jgi:hypothetical protein
VRSSSGEVGAGEGFSRSFTLPFLFLGLAFLSRAMIIVISGYISEPYFYSILLNITH